MLKRSLALLLLLLLRRLPIWKAGHKLNVAGTRREEISQWCAAPDTHTPLWMNLPTFNSCDRAAKEQKRKENSPVPSCLAQNQRAATGRYAFIFQKYHWDCQEFAMYDNPTDLIIDPFILINHWWLTETAASQVAHDVADFSFSVVEGIKETHCSYVYGHNARKDTDFITSPHVLKQKQNPYTANPEVAVFRRPLPAH